MSNDPHTSNPSSSSSSHSPRQRKRSWRWLLLPATILLPFLLLLGFMATGLTLNPRDLPSPLIGKAAPDFSLPLMETRSGQEKFFQPEELRGKVWLLNVWASWCTSCALEHPDLLAFAREYAEPKGIPFVGLNYKELNLTPSMRATTDPAARKIWLDKARAQGIAWLAPRGNPYSFSVMDLDGRTGLDYGVYGVPETYVIDRLGVIRHKHTGPVSRSDLQLTIRPLIEKLLQSTP